MLEANVAASAPREGSLAVNEALAKFAHCRSGQGRPGQNALLCRPDTPRDGRSTEISLATAERYWAYARRWLFAELERPETSPRENL